MPDISHHRLAEVPGLRDAVVPALPHVVSASCRAEGAPVMTLPAGELERLLELAHAVVTWTTQDTVKPQAAGTPHLTAARQAYYRARLDAYSRIRPLTIWDTGGCTCAVPCGETSPDCMYHYAASLQPENHKIPWNCPTFYDGCNCTAEGT